MAKRIKQNNGSAKTIAPATDTSAPIDTNAPADTEATYRAAVEEGKALTASMSGKQWAIGDLADTVEKAYGENRLGRYAEDINFAGEVCTLARCRNVCRAFPKTGGRPRFFAAAQMLQAHPARIEIVERNPNISKAEAREIMRQWRAEQGDTTADQPEEDDLLEEADTEPMATDAEQPEDEDLNEPEEGTGPTSAATASPPAKAAKAKGPKKTANAGQANEWSGDNKRWQSDVVVVATKAIDLAEVRKNCTPEQRRNLLTVLEPSLVETVRKASEALAELVAWLDELLDEGADTKIREGRVKNSPAPAQEPVHAALR